MKTELTLTLDHERPLKPELAAAIAAALAGEEALSLIVREVVLRCRGTCGEVHVTDVRPARLDDAGRAAAHAEPPRADDSLDEAVRSLLSKAHSRVYALAGMLKFRAEGEPAWPALDDAAVHKAVAVELEPLADELWALLARLNLRAIAELQERAVAERALDARPERAASPEPYRRDGGRPVNERVHLRIIAFPCCGRQLCWISQRLPTYCPECGKLVYTQLRDALVSGSLLGEDPRATLRYVAH